ncbi:hypothetical protein DERF_008765 [Dermatophagoides farinae]|uniref:Ig-like domain-containing protein n=1 Tax=Dermatophagoides farinae TaxID=6954 RepID=A0A922I0L1_DERFA|nr:hypothetical protein DERF_008765 [Dermatophagoides farinae]
MKFSTISSYDDYLVLTNVNQYFGVHRRLSSLCLCAEVNQIENEVYEYFLRDLSHGTKYEIFETTSNSISLRWHQGDNRNSITKTRQGSDLVLTCNVAKGSKPLRFQWFKNGVELSNTGRSTIENKDIFLFYIEKYRFQ